MLRFQSFRPLFRGCFLFVNTTKNTIYLIKQCFRPLFRGCFLFSLVGLASTEYVDGRMFPSPLSGMFFILEDVDDWEEIPESMAFPSPLSGMFFIHSRTTSKYLNIWIRFPSPLSGMFFIHDYQA